VKLWEDLRAFACATSLVALVSGCGGGGGAPATVVGAWSHASIGQPGQVASALVPCPNSITLASSGAVVSCKTSQNLTLNADGTFVVDLVTNQVVDPSTTFRLATRTWGTYTNVDGRIACTITSRGTDFDSNGLYDPTEVTPLIIGSTLSMSIREVKASSMLAEITLDGVTHTALYTKAGLP
jgi:hypothetical protein